MSAYLGTQPGESQYLLDVSPYQTNHLEVYTATEGNIFTMAGQEYVNGLICWDGFNPVALFNLNGQYTRLTFTVGHLDGSSMSDTAFQIHLDGKLAGEYSVSVDGLPSEYTLDLNITIE